MEKLNYDKYIYLKEKLKEYIIDNKLWELSNKDLLRKTNIFQDYEDIRVFRKHNIEDQVLDSLIFSKFKKRIICTNLVGDCMIIEDRKKFTKFMRLNNEKLIKQSKIYRLFRSRSGM